MTKTLVSIITSSYNKARYLTEAIESVKMQTYSPIEHVIVDGGSTDNTIDLLKSRENEQLTWISEKDNGQYDGVNKGFQLAKGEIIGWLDADDTYEKDAVNIAVEFLNNHVETDFVYGDYNFIDGKGSLIEKRRVLDFHYPTLLYNVCYISPQTVFFRRRILDSVGPLNTDLKLIGDYDFFIRVAKQCNVVHINSVLGNYRVHDETFSRDSKCRKIFRTERFQIRRLHAGLEDCSKIKARIILEILRRSYQSRRYMLMALSFLRGNKSCE